MRILRIGDIYVGKDGVVSTHPRGEGLDAAYISLDELLDRGKRPAIERMLDGVLATYPETARTFTEALQGHIEAELPAVEHGPHTHPGAALLDRINEGASGTAINKLTFVSGELYHRLGLLDVPEATREEISDIAMTLSEDPTNIAAWARIEAIFEEVLGAASPAELVIQKAEAAVQLFADVHFGGSIEDMRTAVDRSEREVIGTIKERPTFVQQACQNMGGTVVVCQTSAVSGYFLGDDARIGSAVHNRDSSVIGGCAPGTPLMVLSSVHCGSVSEEMWHMIQDHLYPLDEDRKHERIDPLVDAILADSDAVRRKIDDRIRSSGRIEEAQRDVQVVIDLMDDNFAVNFALAEMRSHLPPASDAERFGMAFRMDTRELFAKVALLFVDDRFDRGEIEIEAPQTAALLFPLIDEIRAAVPSIEPKDGHDKHHFLEMKTLSGGRGIEV